MRAVCVLVASFLWTSVVSAQQSAKPTPPKDVAVQSKARGRQALAEVRVLKAAQCSSGITVEMEDCLSKLNKRADHAYTGYVLALGALIRSELADPDFSPKPPAPGARLPFDEGETAWMRYRDQTAEQQFDLAQGATLGPVYELSTRLQITLAHVQELQDQYDELWK